jgi:hypothetical protein
VRITGVTPPALVTAFNFTYMERTVKMQIDVPEGFSKELDHKLIDLKEGGVRKSKAQYIVELAQEAFLKKQVNAEIK